MNEPGTIAPERRISVRTVADRSTPFGRRLWALGPLLDRVLGIDALHRLGEQCDVFGREPLDFATHALDGMGVRIQGAEQMAARLPREGPVIVVANHPHGGIEGLIMLRLLMAERDDVKVLANTALQVFHDLKPVMLFVNPLMPNNPANAKGLKHSLRHLREGGVLVVFPASRTSFYRRELGRISDGEWNRIVASLGRKTGAAVLPVRFCDFNSDRFYQLGRVWSRFRLLMLARELLNKVDTDITVAVGAAIPPKHFAHLEEEGFTEALRLLTYSLRPQEPSGAPVEVKEPAPLAPARQREVVEAEIDTLPPEQIVYEGHGCVVLFGRRAQFPELVAEITRERERTFRLLDEGSGAPVDTDEFDDLADHIVVWDRRGRGLLGAYRMGRRDQLVQRGGTYLDQMFEFDDAFFAQHGGALELGRSFVTPEYQRARHSLDLLWRGIGGFVRAHPQYTLLYGTVSLTTQYDPVSTDMMCDVLIDAPGHVRPKAPLKSRLTPDWAEYRQRWGIDRLQLDKLIAAREEDGKGLPILVRQYAALGARFHAVGVDPNFAATPGLLLSVNIATIPPGKRKRYIDP
ncbi:MAG: GNAT family N-acyltransferase [Pseudomonadota bacterium]